jgi:hypothetical protein
MKKVLLSVSAIGLLLIGSCKKGDSGSGGKSSILTSGKWQLTASTSQSIVSGVAGTLDDDYTGMDACEKDDYTLFDASSKLIINDEGATKCDASDPQQTNNGLWALTNNDTWLLQTNSLITINWNIEQLDDNTLKMSNYDTSGTTVYKSTSTFKHVK